MTQPLHSLPRVLHLTDAAGPDGAAGSIWACACAASLPGLAHETWAIGGPEAQAAARAAGLHPCVWASPPLGRAELAWPALRRVRARHGDPACVVAWSPRAARLARMLFTKRVPIVVPRIGVPGNARAQGWNVPAPPLAPPLVALPRWPGVVRQQARENAGLRADDVAIVLLADPIAHADAAAFTRHLSMAATAGHRAVGLVLDGTPSVARAARFLATTGASTEIVRLRGTLLDALRVADAAFWQRPDFTGTDTGLVLVAAVVASGIPVLAGPGIASAWLLGESRGTQIARGTADHQMADLVACFADDPARVRAVAAANAQRLARGPEAWWFHEGLMDAIARVSAGAVAA